MTILITDRDQKILRYMEEYKYATIDQLQKIFCSWQDSSYNIIRRRMTEIHKADYIKVDKDKYTNKLVYIWNDKKIKPPSRHRLILLDVLAKLHSTGAEVQEFDVEKEWMDGKVRSDGFTIFTAKPNDSKPIRIHYFIEVHLSNSPLNIEKYDRLYESGEVQKFLNRNVFPRVLLITDRNVKNLDMQYSSVTRLNTKLEPFLSVSLPPQK